MNILRFFESFRTCETERAPNAKQNNGFFPDILSNNIGRLSSVYPNMLILNEYSPPAGKKKPLLGGTMIEFLTCSFIQPLLQIQPRCFGHYRIRYLLCRYRALLPHPLFEFSCGRSHNLFVRGWRGSVAMM